MIEKDSAKSVSLPEMLGMAVHLGKILSGKNSLFRPV